MKIFLDSADVQEIKELATTGLIAGVTTNPSLIAKSGQDFKKVIAEICDVVQGPISAEVTSLIYDDMMREALILSKINSNVVIKVPLTFDGLKACTALRAQDINVNVTLCFSSAQALLAGCAQATYISPFVGRLDDLSFDGIQLIEEISQIYQNDPDITTQILAASIRHPLHVVQAAQAGADVVTIPAKVFKQLYEHPLTQKGLEVFMADWASTKQIL
ncbi:MAG: fructose-6-phosphate aldolase [Janthinobacterium lividum]